MQQHHPRILLLVEILLAFWFLHILYTFHTDPEGITGLKSLTFVFVLGVDCWLIKRSLHQKFASLERIRSQESSASRWEHVKLLEGSKNATPHPKAPS